MQNDPRKSGQAGRGASQQRKTSFVGKSAAERRAERRAGSAAASGPASAQSEAKSSTIASGSVGSTSRTLDRRAERERERRRRRLVTMIAIAAVALLVIIGLLIITRTPDEAPVPETARARYSDLLQSRNTEGYPLLGNATAPVVVTLYSAFDCLPCKAFHDAVIDGLIERVRSDQIAVEFVPLYGRNDATNGQGAAIAAVCAAQQNLFWLFQDMLYSWLGQFPANLVFRNNRIIGGVINIGLDLGAYEGCRNSGLAGDLLERARLRSVGLLNFAGPPTVAINGVVPVNGEGQPITDPEGVLAAIDDAVARVTGQLTAPAEPQVEPETTPEIVGTPTTGSAESTPEASQPDSEMTAEAVEPAATIGPEATPPEVTPEATP
jgi:hypothetical protein